MAPGALGLVDLKLVGGKLNPTSGDLVQVT